MLCTKCHKKKNISEFSYKNNDLKILYLHCDYCRDKIKSQNNKKIRENDNYNFIKSNNIIQCKCGKSYIAFRDYHINRHNNTLFHIKNISSSIINE